MLKYIKQSYVTVLQTAVWLFSLISPFVIAPPVVFPDQDKLWIQLVQFFIAAFVGLMLYPMMKYAKRRFVKAWWIASAILFVFGMAATLTYLITYSKNTVLVEIADNTSARLVKGNVLTPNGESAKKELTESRNGQVPTDEELVGEFALRNPGQMTKVWTSGSIDANVALLSALHLLANFLLCGLVLCVVQVLKCLNVKSNEL